MSFKVRFTPQAAADVSEAADYIASRFGNATVLKFQGSLEAMTEFIGLFPYVTQIYGEDLGVRKFSMLKYPYTLYLRIDDEVMEVIAFTLLHQKRNPEKIHKFVVERLKHDTK